ncbi:MAG: hypothetical protein ACT4OF_13595 [Caulobacteraceae bacterium]
MRCSLLAIGLTLAACASPASVTTSSLTAADAATSLAVGDRVTQRIAAHQPSADGMDPVINLTLRHADGRSLRFQQGNHTNEDLMAQRPGGPLAQIMGLAGEESPVLYHATQSEGAGSPFFCGPEGPAALGVYEGADSVTQIVGLRQQIQFETRPDGQMEALPYSPDQVCARLRFRRG